MKAKVEGYLWKNYIKVRSLEGGSSHGVGRLKFRSNLKVGVQNGQFGSYILIRRIRFLLTHLSTCSLDLSLLSGFSPAEDPLELLPDELLLDEE